MTLLPRKSRGMTLIELVIIIGLGAVLTLGIVKFTFQQINTGVKMRDYLTALNLARLKMALANNTDYTTLGAATTTLAQEASFTGFDVQRIVGSEVTGAPYGVKIKKIDIKVDYVGGSFANPLVWLTTYREDHVTFGDGA